MKISSVVIFVFLLSPAAFAQIVPQEAKIELNQLSAEDIQLASVCFLGFGECGGFDNYTLDAVKQCQQEGFSKQNCNSVQMVDEVCPYNSAYGRGCKCISNLVSCPAGQTGVGDSCGGKYLSCQCASDLIACSADKIGQGSSCGGKYQTCICKPEYKYSSATCSSPRSLSGFSCDGKYTGCVCPSGVFVGTYGCETYYPSPCNSTCKKAYADNCRNRSSVDTPYGCAEFWSDCSSKCKTAYKDNCRNRTAASCSYNCAAYWGDCASKCQTCALDNCSSRTAAIESCPDNAVCSSFVDCPSKIESWNCDSGYLNLETYWCYGALKCWIK